MPPLDVKQRTQLLDRLMGAGLTPEMALGILAVRRGRAGSAERRRGGGAAIADDADTGYSCFPYHSCGSNAAATDPSIRY
jgi:hypothetical protein